MAPQHRRRPELTLRPPGPDDEAVCRALHEQVLADDFEFLLAEGSWEEILGQVGREAAGVDLAEGWVPADFLLAEVDGDVVGRASIRHELNDFLLNLGGHVGYAVAPAHRRKGYATEILRQSVERLDARGVHRVLVTCDDTNVASAAVIKGCGGVLEDIRDAGEGQPPRRRYWITTRVPS